MRDRTLSASGLLTADTLRFKAMFTSKVRYPVDVAPAKSDSPDTMTYRGSEDFYWQRERERPLPVDVQLDLAIANRHIDSNVVVVGKCGDQGAEERQK